MPTFTPESGFEVRHPLRTWDGKPIGFVEKLEADNPRRKAYATCANRVKGAQTGLLAMFKHGREKGQQSPKRRIAISTAQARSDNSKAARARRGA